MPFVLFTVLKTKASLADIKVWVMWVMWKSPLFSTVKADLCEASGMGLCAASGSQLSLCRPVSLVLAGPPWSGAWSLLSSPTPQARQLAGVSSLRGADELCLGLRALHILEYKRKDRPAICYKYDFSFGMLKVKQLAMSVIEAEVSFLEGGGGISD